MGYLATNESYRDYHLSIEYNWGDRTDGSPFVRNSGILLHATGKHGNAKGVWMASVECQLAQGCEGDSIVILVARTTSPADWANGREWRAFAKAIESRSRSTV